MPRLRVPRLRLSLGASLAAVATLVVMVGLPAPARAAVNISITSAGLDGSGDPYDLTVVASDTNGTSGLQLTTMSAHVFNASDQELPSSPYAMSYVSGPPGAQTWAATSPIPQADLPPGTYTVTVDASDGTETDLGLPAPAPFSFSYTTTLTVQANPPTVTAGSDYVTFTGTVQGSAPGGTPVGLPIGTPVNLSIGGGTTNQVTTTTDSNGDFSYPIGNITQSGDYYFTVDATGTYSAANYDVKVTTQQAATTIAVTANPTSVSEGSPGVTFTGNVTVIPQGSTVSSGIGSGVPVDVSINGGTPAFAGNTSDASGDFSYQAPPIAAAPPTDTTMTYTFSVASTNLWTAASATPVTIQANPASSTIVATPTPAFVTFGSQNVSFSGAVTASPPPGGTTVPVPGASVYLNGDTSPLTTTDTNGNFPYLAPTSSANTTYTFSINPTNLYSGYSDPVTVNAIDGQTNMTVTANPPFVHLGSSTVNFTGAVTVTPAGSTTPVPVGSGVSVYLNGGSSAVATTDSSGGFTYQATGVTQTSVFNFSVNAGTLYTAATCQVSVNLDQLTTNLTVTPDQTSVTEGSQTVTFTGTVTGIPPGSTTPQPISGVPVDLTGVTTNPVATTDAQGQFIYQASAVSKAGQFDFSVASTPNYTAGTANVAIGVIQAATRFTGVKIAPAQLKYGQKATLTGSLQYKYGTTWTALAGTAIQLFEGKTGIGSVKTGKNGSFTATLPTTHGAAWSATLPAAPLLRQASAIGNLSISVPMKVKLFVAKLNALDIVRTSGCLQVTVPVRYGPESKIVIQYASRSRGPWKTLGKLQLYNVAGAPALCRDANESYFSGGIHAKLANAYYRADFPANDSFQHTASPVIHAWRYQTRITNYNVSPRSVSTGDKVKISGRLWLHGKSWKPYGKRKVDIVYNEKGTSYWAHLGKPLTTSSSGHFSETAVASSGKFVAIIYAVYTGSRTDLEVQSRGIAVAINESSTIVSPPPTPSPGLPVILLPTYRGLGMLARDAVALAAREIRVLAFWPR